MSKFKVGDSVEVLSSTTDMQELQETIGHSYKVSIVYYGNCPNYKLSNGYWYRECELKLLWPVGVSSPVFNHYVKDTKELTQPELQFLTKFLSDTLCSLQSDIRYYKARAANIWDKCNKEEEHSGRWFKTLNHYKDHTKELKKTVKKLSEVQGKLKRKVGK